MDVYNEHVEVLRWIVDLTNAYIVFSSTWRLRYLDKCSSLLMSRDVFQNTLFSSPFYEQRAIGMTPRIHDVPRGAEIDAWLKENSHAIENFVILDDDRDMEPYMDKLIHCNNKYGLTYLEGEKVVEALLGKEVARRKIFRK